MIELPLVIGISPFECPDFGLVASLARAGALGVLDLGHDPGTARLALDALAPRARRPFGVRCHEHTAHGIELPEFSQVVVVPASVGCFDWGSRTVLAQVTSIDEAKAAIAAGVSGLIAKGHEAAGAVGDETSFVLLQRLLAETRLPIWVQGGIGLHSAAASVAIGARGVVLDGQLALLEESSTTPDLRRALTSFDGSETAVVSGCRVYKRTAARPSQPHGAKVSVSNAQSDSVPLGQDAALAREFAERFGTVERLIRGIGSAIEGHLRQARVLRPLAPGSPFARATGAKYPLVQGPMTRVSDRAAFAEAVARAGGVPFVALSLLRGADAKELLAQTRDRLGNLPWGVGILGFAPPELREEQLALLREVRPPLAIVAGGRPAQAAILEQVGIKAFLHIPSPGLLDMFWNEGARRFVFEGLECGGHVGPRSSYALWDVAVERLLSKGALGDVSVIFAGGIHDARSACAVSVLAAPLAARGAAVGALMGTAYLFTKEAVATGAIGEVFQREAVECRGTALLQTAPGHATRCTSTDYVRAFEVERARLEAQGKPAEEIWADLERMNVGRLRLAAKGLRRDGDRLVEVDADEQRRDGMFMIGQVAALRSELTTLERLHREVSVDGTAALDAERAPRDVATKSSATDIAIVGLACILPDAPDAASYWKNVLLGHDAIREVSAERWNTSIYYDQKGTGEKTPSKWGGFVPPTIIDPTSYGIPPRSMAAIDPVQILSLEVSRRALDDAGYANRPFDRERTGVVFGAEAGADLANAFGFRTCYSQYHGSIPPELDAALPKLTEDSFPGVLGNVIAGRIANRLDLRGINFTVDAACASSLAALDVACKELVANTSDLMIAGGADLHNSIYDYLMFASVHALSATGRSCPFDASADGIVISEGVAAVVLKRLADAERDGDRIYAVIQGVGGSSDGKSLGLTAPRKEGQLRALERAYERAGHCPATVGLVEAHGTGTVVGDRVELTGLTEFFEASGAALGSCTLGSVKSQIGHTKCTAGMAALIKTTLAVYHGVLPPTRNVEQPNPAYDRGTSPFVFRASAAPWLGDERVAGVSAFGFGGTNFHAVISSHVAPSKHVTLTQWPAELFVLRGGSRDEALRGLDRLDALAAAECPPPVRDLAGAVARLHAKEPTQAAFLASSHADLRAKVAALREHKKTPGVFEAEPLGGQVAFLFPGQGSQRPSMLSDLFVNFPELRDLLSLGEPWIHLLFPGGAFTAEAREAQERAVTDTRVAQPALGIAGLAMARLLGKFGVRPAMAGGHSYGELVALSIAGAFNPAALIALSQARAQAMFDVAGTMPSGMAAARASAERVREALGDLPVTLANHNAPDQVVIAGSTEHLAQACEKLAAAGVATKVLPVACAFHSPIMARAGVAFADALSRVELHAPQIPVFANATAQVYASAPDAMRTMLSAQISNPVRFVEEIEAMYEAGARIFVEAGPGGVLTGLVSRILNGKVHAAIACDRPGTDGIVSLLTALGLLACAGVDVDFEPLFANRAAPLDLDQSADHYRAPATAWRVDGGGARPMHGPLPEFAMKPVTKPLAAVSVASVKDDREGVVREYLRSIRESVEGQRQVMLQYLGGPVPLSMGPTVEAVPAPAPTSQALQPQTSAKSSPSQHSALQKTASPWEVLTTALSERTGYPIDMLDPNLNLEADLGIDSIKRVEILGVIRDQLGLGKANGSQDVLEELTRAKTIKQLVDLLEAQVRANATVGEAQTEDTPAEPSEQTKAEVAQATSVTSPAPTPSSAAAPGQPTAVTTAVRRYVVEVQSVAPAKQVNGLAVAGRRFAIAPDKLGVARALLEILRSRGAEARLIEADEEIGDIDGLVLLDTLSTDLSDSARSLFQRIKQASRVNPTWIMVATGLGGRFGQGLPTRARSGVGASGFLKSLVKENVSLRARAVDLALDEEPQVLAEQLFRELLADDSHVEVGYAKGERYILVARPSSPLSASAAPLALDADSVVVLLGGARGITSLAARALARRFRCKIRTCRPFKVCRAGRGARPTGCEQCCGCSARVGRARSGTWRARPTCNRPAVPANSGEPGNTRDADCVSHRRVRTRTIIRWTCETKLPWQRSSISCASGTGASTSSFTAPA